LSTKWNFSSFDWVALTIRTGTETSPNEITPDQIERGGMGSTLPPGSGRKRRRFTTFGPGLQQTGDLLHLTGG